MAKDKDYKDFQKFLEREGINGSNTRAKNKQLIYQSNQSFDFEKTKPMKYNVYIIITILLIAFTLFTFSCEKVEECEPKCEKQYGLVTYWLHYPSTRDTLHLTNIGFKDCDGKYWKLSEPTIALIGKDILVDTSYAHEIYFNFVSFKPFR